VAVAARQRPAGLLGDIGDIHRFASRGHFASCNGTAPLDASSGDQTRHRLSRVGNRRINRVLHIMAVVQLRHATPGRAYYRRLSDVVYRQMARDAGTNAEETSPGGQRGCGSAIQRG
jgi:transposase